MKIYFLSIFFCALSALALAKAPSEIIDSLKQKLEIESVDSVKVELWNELAWLYREDSITLATEYAEKALDLATLISFPSGIATAYNRLGVIQKNRGDYKTAITSYSKGLEIRKQIGELALVASSYLNIGNIHQHIGDSKLAIESYELGLESLKEKDDLEVRAKLNVMAGKLCANIGQSEKAILFLEESLKIIEVLNSPRITGSTYLTLGGLHRKLQHKNQAINTFEKALGIYESIMYKRGIASCYQNIGNVYFENKKYKEATNYLKKSVEIKRKFPPDTDVDLDNTYETLGIIAETRGNYSKALDYYNECLRLRKKFNKINRLGDIYHNIGNVYLGRSQYRKALDNYQKALPITEKQEDKYELVGLYQNISNAYSSLQDHQQALEYSQKSIQLRDQLEIAYHQANDLQNSLGEERQKRTIAEKEQEILQAENDKLQVQTQGQLGVLVLFIIGLFILVRYIKAKTGKEKAQHQAQKALFRIDDLIRDQELKATYARLEGQESAQKRIARDLHDRLGGMLSTVKMYYKAFDNQAPDLPEQNRKQLNNANQLLDDACEEVRRISHNLEALGLKEFGLVKQISLFAKNIEEAQAIKINYHTHGLKERLPLAMEAKIYQMILELIGNTLKHAKATEITIQLSQIKNNLNILVEDNGEGFEVEVAMEKEKGLGLVSIKDTVFQLKGTLNIDSGRGAGTTIDITVPVLKTPDKIKQKAI